MFWLNDEEWQRIKPFFARGVHRFDDRRVISGILSTCCFLAPAGGTARLRTVPIRRSTTVLTAGAAWASGWRCSKLSRAAHGRDWQCRIGRSRGGRTSAIHARTDATGRPRVLLIAPGNLHDVMLASELLSAAEPIEG